MAFVLLNIYLWIYTESDFIEILIMMNYFHGFRSTEFSMWIYTESDVTFYCIPIKKYIAIYIFMSNINFYFLTYK